LAPERNNLQHRPVVAIAGILIAILAIAFWLLNRILYTHAPGTSQSSVEFTVLEGASLNSIARKLSGEKLIINVGNFKLAALLLRADKKLQPGIFLLPHGATNVQIIRHLLRPGIQAKNVTIPEGLNLREIAGLLQNELLIDSVEFIMLCYDPSMIEKMKIEAKSLEGYLFPETYNFYRNTTPALIIERMVELFNHEFSVEHLQKGKKLGLSRHSIVTFASIVQGEVMNWDEANLVSAVYHNRLRKRIRLGADPTIQYIIPDGPRRLLNRDLKIDNPYNTYKYYGLPPGPINNPGRRALKAAVNPADVDYIYFVAKGDGSHYFNLDHIGHERDKAKLQKIRRRVARERQGR